MSGLAWESYRFKDISFEKAFGPFTTGPIVALGRDVSGIPIVCQGTENTCVACSITWIKQYLEKEHPDLSHEWLASISNTGPNGAKPSQVLEPARKTGILSQYLWGICASGDCFVDAAEHRIPGYAFLEDLSPSGIYNALKLGPVMIGVDDWMGMGPHMMVAYDVTDDGTALKAVSWGNSSVQEDVVVMFKAVELAIFVGELPVSLEKDQSRLPMLTVLKDKLSSLSLKKIFAGIGVIIAALTGGVAAQKQFGAAGVASGYRTTLSASITASQPYFTVSSVTLTSGGTLSTSTLRLGEGQPVYLKINPGGATEETVECYGLSTRTWNMCGRSIGYLGTGTTSTVASRAFAHAAGEAVIVANDAPFYNRFVDTYTNQSVTGTKTFLANHIKIGDSSTLAQYIYFMNGQTNAPYFKTVKGSTSSTFYFSQDGTSELQLNSGGTTSGASSTKGLFLTDGLFGINASSTGGIGFDSSGLALVNVSSTASDNGGFLKRTFTTANEIYWDIVSFLSRSNIWSGTSSTFTGSVNFSGNVTSTGTLRVTTPVADLDATPKTYVDTGLQFLSATGTAGATVTAGRALYLNTSGQLLHTNTSAVSTTFAYVGVAVTGGTVGQTISYTREGGINCAQSGLSASVDYFLNGTAGQISGTPASNQAQIGKAISSTCIHLISPRYRVAGSTTITTNGGLYFATGFYPRVVSIQASGSGSESMSLGDQNGNSIYAFRGTGAPTGNFGVSSGNVYRTYNTAANAESRSGTILLDPSGFTITTTNGASPQNVGITWYATN